MKSKLFLAGIVFLLLISALSIVQNNVFAQENNGLEYKHHIWTLNNVDVSASFDLNNDKVESDLNTFFDKISGIVNGFDGGELHIYTGKNGTFEGKKVLFIAPFFKLSNKIDFDSQFFLTINSIVNWSEGENLYIDQETANELAFYIPKDSVVPLFVGPAMMYLPETPVPMPMSVESITGTRFVDYSTMIVHTAYVLALMEMDTEFAFGTTNTLPLPIYDFVVGMPIGDPNAIQAYGSVWDNLDQENLNFQYSASGGKATFTAKGSYSDEQGSVNLDVNFEYSLDTGLLLSAKASFSVHYTGELPETEAYGAIEGTVDFSASFDLGYKESKDYTAWESPGEPLAYKITEFQASDLVEQALNATEGPSTEDELFYDDVESGNIGWTANGTWAISEYGMWYATNLTPYQYSVLISPSINTAGYTSVRVSFDYIRISFSGFHAELYVSWDDGDSWVYLSSFYDTDGEVEHYEHEIGVESNSLKIMFKVYGDESIDATGVFFVDNISVVGERSIGVFDLLQHARTVNTFVDNPTGLDAQFYTVFQYVDPDTGDILNLTSFYQSQGTFVAGSLKVIPEKDIIYGQMLFEVHTITNILPKILKYQLHIAEVKDNETVPKIEISGQAGIYESTQGHFAILSNVTFSIDYSNASEGDTPFTAEGGGGVWYVYKESGYLVEVGVQFHMNVKVDTDDDGDLSDEDVQEVAFVVVSNKVVSKKVTKNRAEQWIIDWDTLDSDPPPFSDKAAWNLVGTPESGLGGGFSPSLIMAIGIVAIIGVVMVVLLLLRKRGKE